MSKSKILSALSSFSDKFSERIDSIFAKKTDLTAHTNNADIHMSDVERTKLSGISAGAEVNTIELIKVNGTALTPDSSKAVNISVDSDSAYGTCSTAAATAAKVVTIVDNPNWKLKAGSEIIVKFTETNTAQNPTLNVNGTGAKSIWYNTALITTGSLAYAGAANRPMKFAYDGTQYVFMGWSLDSNTTYTPHSLGFGYGTCSTAAATVAKVVSLSSYVLVKNGFVAVKFTYAVPASATMNINSKGAKAIYHRGAAITAGVINAGDIAYFIYNGSQYHLLGTDKPFATDSDIDAIIAGTYS